MCHNEASFSLRLYFALSFGLDSVGCAMCHTRKLRQQSILFASRSSPPSSGISHLTGTDSRENHMRCVGISGWQFRFFSRPLSLRLRLRRKSIHSAQVEKGWTDIELHQTASINHFGCSICDRAEGGRPGRLFIYNFHAMDDRTSKELSSQRTFPQRANGDYFAIALARISGQEDSVLMNK